MFGARVICGCPLRAGAELRANEALLVCEVLDADLVATGRTVVALAGASTSVGELVQLAALDGDHRGFDLGVIGSIHDLGIASAPRGAPGSRVWLREHRQVRRRPQPQNRH